MARGTLSRRQFGRRLGEVGAALVAHRFATLPAEARQLLGVPDDVVVRLSANENPYGPSPRALEAMTRSQGVAGRYPDALRVRVAEAIAKLHNFQPENVLLGCGSGEILRVTDMAFLAPSKNVVAAEPTFEAVFEYARVTRAEPIKVPLTTEGRHDLPRMAEACNERTGLVYVCNPNNPTGTVVTRDELAAFLGQVPKSAIVLVDEAYHHFVEDPRYASAIEWVGKAPNLVVARTFSKIYGMAGMRLGYAVSSRENIRAMQQHALFDNANASVLEAALASLADPDHVPACRKRINDSRRWLCRELEKDGRRYLPSETNFVMLDVGGDVQPVIQEFEKRKILVGRKFPSMSNWLRVSIGTQKEMEIFLAGLRAIVPARAEKAA